MGSMCVISSPHHSWSECPQSHQDHCSQLWWNRNRRDSCFLNETRIEDWKAGRLGYASVSAVARCVPQYDLYDTWELWSMYNLFITLYALCFRLMTSPQVSESHLYPNPDRLLTTPPSHEDHLSKSISPSVNTLCFCFPLSGQIIDHKSQASLERKALGQTFQQWLFTRAKFAWNQSMQFSLCWTYETNLHWTWMMPFIYRMSFLFSHCIYCFPTHAQCVVHLLFMPFLLSSLLILDIFITLHLRRVYSETALRWVTYFLPYCTISEWVCSLSL